MPGSVQSLVQARLDRLDPADKAALQAASVLGQRFDAAVLRPYSWNSPAMSRDGLVAHLPGAAAGRGSFLFAHALIRDAVYDSLLRSRRRELHRRAADWFAGARPGAPRRAPRPGGGPRGGPRLPGGRPGAGGRVPLRGGAAPGRARPRRSPPRRPTGSRSPCFQGDILHDLGEMPEALVAYEGALDAAADDAERCRAWIGLAAVKRVTDDLDGAFADLERAEAAAAAQGLLAEAARVHYLRGNLCFPRGDIEGCLREHGRSLELARRAGRPSWRRRRWAASATPSTCAAGWSARTSAFSGCVELCRRHGLGRIEVANRPRSPTRWSTSGRKGRLWSERWQQRRQRPGSAISGRS